MLKLVIDTVEIFDEETQMFGTAGGFEIELEHSLVSLSKWESKTKKPFLTKEGKTREEIMFYIQCMIVSQDCPSDAVSRFSQKEIDIVTAYIESPESATTFGEMPATRGRGETITSELIYYWMIAFTIPFDCETWHLNRLFSLVRICNIKNQKPKRMSKEALAGQYRRVNEKRRKELGTSG